MSSSLRIVLLTTLLIIALLIGIFYAFNISFAVTSAQNIKYSAAQDSEMATTIDALQKPKNMIIFVADGMGFAHLSLAMYSLQSEQSTSVWKEFEVKGWHDPRPYFGPITDSGASATAMATGSSTNHGVIGLDHDEKPIMSVFEMASVHQYNTGIVTDSYVWDATPAAFVAHTDSRDNAREILTQIAASDLDLLFGELEDLGEDDVPELEETMEILTRKFELLDDELNIPNQGPNSKPIAAIFEEDEIQELSNSPNLPQLTTSALSHLGQKDSPFVLLVESEEIDSGSHENNSGRVLKGLKVIQETLRVIIDYSKANGETLVLFTSDHETGGLALVTTGKIYPDLKLKWSTQEHTAAVVPLMAQGPGAAYFRDINRNWEIGRLLKGLIKTNDN